MSDNWRPNVGDIYVVLPDAKLIDPRIVVEIGEGRKFISMTKKLKPTDQSYGGGARRKTICNIKDIFEALGRLNA